MKRIAMAVAVMAALVAGAGAQMYEPYSYGAGPVEDDYKWSFELAQPIAERDFISTGLCWIFDSTDRDTRTTSTEILTSSVTATDPETGIAYTTVTETPHTTTNTVEGADYSGLGLYVITPIFRFSGIKVSAGVVVPVEDLSETWPALQLGYTFRGLELGEYVISSFEVGGVLLLNSDDEAMGALSIGLVY